MRQWKVGLAYGLAMAVCGLIAVVFVLVAITIALASRYGAVEACLGLAALFAIGAIAAAYFRRRAVEKAEKRAKQDARRALVSTVTAGVTSSPKTASLFALIAGYFLLRK